MTTLKCKFFYTYGHLKDQVCGNPVLSHGFCRECLKKIGNPPLSYWVPKSEKNLEEIMINHPILCDKAIMDLYLNGKLHLSLDFSDSNDEKEKFINFYKDSHGIISGAILDEVRKEENSPRMEHRIWFYENINSDKTNFEKMSNRLEIGVIARTRRSALALLMLLRMVYDEHPNPGYSLIKGFGKHKELKKFDLKKVPVCKILDIINTVFYSQYMNAFCLKNTFQSKLSDGPKRLYEVDVWTVTRFENE